MIDHQGSPVLSLRPLAPTDSAALADLFASLRANGDTRFFEPHPMTPEEAEARVCYHGLDVYVAAEERGVILGYGMLRGWDEGYAVPSLGIVVHPVARGAKIGQLLMLYLHAVARRRGADQVRLRVHAENASARHLYGTLGYEFADGDGGYLVGTVIL